MVMQVGSGRRGTSAGAGAGSVRIESNRRRRSGRRVTVEAPHTFLTATEELDGGTAVVSVIGEVDVATTATLEQTLLGVADDRTRVIVDFTECGFLDCAGLNVLIAARARMERSQRSLALVLSKPGVLKIFQITALDEVFDIYPSRRAAVHAHGNGRG